MGNMFGKTASRGKESSRNNLDVAVSDNTNDVLRGSSSTIDHPITPTNLPLFLTPPPTTQIRVPNIGASLTGLDKTHGLN